MGCLDDKPFGATPGCAGDAPFSPVVPPTSGWVPPVPGAVDPAAVFPCPWGPVQNQPDQVMAQDLVVGQALNSRALALKAVGEDMLVYRQKKFGQTCACVDPATNQAADGCRICFGTRFVKGYDFLGKSVGTVGPNPLTRKLTELGLTLSQKPMLTMMPDFPLKDRDFIVALARTPTTDNLRFQAEPVVRGALNPNIDPLSKLNARRVQKISLTADGAVLSVPNPLPISTADNGYDLPPQVGGGEDFAEGMDFVLTGGELTVTDALTPPLNSDTRVLRVLGKRAPLSPPDGEDVLGQTVPVATLYVNAGLSAGLAANVFCQAAQPQAFATALQAGTGADAGFFIVILTGAVGSGISNPVLFPASGFLATVVGSGILWLGSKRPAMSSTYYVSYEAAINATKRYQIQNVTAYHIQGVMISQEAEIELMDQTHPVYNVNSVYDLGAPLDIQVGDLDTMRKGQGAQSGLVTSAPNNADPRFVNPSDFF